MAPNFKELTFYRCCANAGTAQDAHGAEAQAGCYASKRVAYRPSDVSTNHTLFPALILPALQYHGLQDDQPDPAPRQDP